MKRWIAASLALMFYASILPWAGAEYFNQRSHNVVSDGGNISGFDNGTFTGRITAPSIGSASYTDSGYFADLITRGPWVDVRVFGTLDNAVTQIGATDNTLLISTLCVVTDNLTIPSNIQLVFMKSGRIAPTNGKTVRINGPFNAGRFAVFSGAGTIVFGAGVLSEAFPEWWGAVVNDNTVDNHDYLVAATNACKTVKFARGEYYTSPWLIGGFGWKFSGVGMVQEGDGEYANGTAICAIAEQDYVVKLYGAHQTEFHDMTFNGKDRTITAVFWIGSYSMQTNMARCVIEHTKVNVGYLLKILGDGNFQGDFNRFYGCYISQGYLATLSTMAKVAVYAENSNALMNEFHHCTIAFAETLVKLWGANASFYNSLFWAWSWSAFEFVGGVLGPTWIQNCYTEFEGHFMKWSSAIYGQSSPLYIIGNMFNQYNVNFHLYPLTPIILDGNTFVYSLIEVRTTGFSSDVGADSHKIVSRNNMFQGTAAYTGEWARFIDFQGGDIKPDNTVYKTPVPANSSIACKEGITTYDSDYKYWCYSDNNWRRVSYDNTF